MNTKPDFVTVNVNLGINSYNIYIGRGILPSIGRYLKEIGLGKKIMIVSNPTVMGFHGNTTIKSLRNEGFDVIVGEVPDGEEFKSLESAAKLYDIAFSNNLDRKCAVVALGGGVIGDLAGFVAATYMRGVPFIQIPTTLLAQVDSSVGGKVGVNHPKGKNIIGSFYQPKMVFADIETLHTLPEREFRAGMAEVIKYGIIWDKEFFDYLFESHRKILDQSPEDIIKVVSASCIIKAGVVEEDETEQGLRAILNYGHTFGHAFEALTSYKKYVHGEAVAIGMVSAAGVASRMGILEPEEEKIIKDIITFYRLPVRFEGLKTDEIIQSMYHDKKAADGKVRYVLPETIGRVRITEDVPSNIIHEVLEQQAG